jgi:hypothetical protein
MNVDIGTEAEQLLFREYINGSFVAVKNRLGADDLFLFTAGKLFLDFLNNGR